MLDPSNPTLGRGALLFAVLMLAFAIFLGVWQQAWRDALFWLVIGLFMACYGLLSMNVWPRGQRFLLIVGLFAGGVAFWLALQTSFGW